MNQQLNSKTNKLSKILNFIVILSLVFSTFVLISGESFAFAAPSTPVQATLLTEQKQNKTIQAPKTISQQNSEDLKKVEKLGFKYGLFKFFKAMLYVLISSVAIFIGLKIYKKIVLKNNLKPDNIDYNKNLESPKNFKEAINLFLDKTDK